MRTHSRLLLLAVPALLLAMPAAARAASGGDLYFGYSRLGSSAFNPGAGGLNGWEAVGHFRLKPLLGVEADVSHYGLSASSTVPHTTTVLGGPRITVGVAGVHLFVHGLFGVEHSNNAGGIFSSNAFTVDGGGGMDFRIAPFFAWRVNADYIDAPAHSSSGTHGRFGTGLVFRF